MNACASVDATTQRPDAISTHTAPVGLATNVAGIAVGDITPGAHGYASLNPRQHVPITRARAIANAGKFSKSQARHVTIRAFRLEAAWGGVLSSKKNTAASPPPLLLDCGA